MFVQKRNRLNLTESDGSDFRQKGMLRHPLFVDYFTFTVFALLQEEYSFVDFPLTFTVL